MNVFDILREQTTPIVILPDLPQEIDDDQLKLVPNADVRVHLQRLLVQARLQRRGDLELFEKFRSIRDHAVGELEKCEDHRVPHAHQKSRTRDWTYIRQTAEEEMRVIAAGVTVSTDDVRKLVRRWLVLRMELVERAAGRHDVAGMIIEGGIIVPTAGRPSARRNDESAAAG